MKRVSLIAMLVTLGYGTTVFAGAPGTMRVDYLHSGNNTTEMFSLDQVVIESLPWTGNMAQPLDKTSRGKYLFEIVNPESGDIAWSRSFSSIYGEWETTGESRRISSSTRAMCSCIVSQPCLLNTLSPFIRAAIQPPRSTFC
jgi:hypothetical protein